MISRNVLINCFKNTKSVSLVNLFKTKLNLNFNNQQNNSFSLIKLSSFNISNDKKYYTTDVKNVNDEKNEVVLSETEMKLMEFFDDKKNWSETRVKHGRPWTKDELRNKSNTDLHKLWYVLHKERNMLLTMENFYEKNAMLFPSPERIAKVDESMENVLAVVEERNIAYNLLETGKSNAFIPYRRYNSFGFIQYYRPREYLVPWYLNKNWKLKFHYKRLPYWSKYYRTVYRTYLRKERNKIRKRVNYATKQVLRKHPEYAENTDFVKQHFEKLYGYKPPKPYHELIRKPKPDELPKNLKESMNESDS